ncbi:aspartyl/asparaginyl beta-hydroxylase domain-containing protein [Pseudomonas sp. UBA2684]|uniref:aspartyl/asparaginyl beta-hydroxylase domain-containing protein n=1 Tax=Pseudomonas sp. UBA2684 TaxID=1947311 RepID=UPI000E8C1625|nr:aspartyl/asparaginyl beta-hydroxylase domain-containing protein [Pseudomonas sp. UBA2684]HBX57381.1 aspartyl beta-hydroxylase [Pseudomonas sp.]|tara:strand:+ start:3141 stop:3953 length:813 start_codon:yes stop_codon:yes gene_type:complete
MTPSHSALPAYARLPLRVDVALLQAALQAIPDAAWSAHFNTDYYRGDWSGVALLSPAGAHDPLAAAHGGDSTDTHATPWHSARWQQVLAGIAMRISSARLLRLGAGAHISEHCDPDLSDPQGDVRLHIPIRSHPAVEFLLEGQVIPMAVGECWFLDLARPHRVDNRSEQARIHLVIDARRNDWLRAQISAGLATTPAAQIARSTLAFNRFRQRVHADTLLAGQLNRLENAREFAERAVQLGAQLDLHFAIDDVRSAMRQGRRAWSEQWTV